MKIEFCENCIPPRVSHHAKKIVRIGGFSRMADKPELVAAKSFWDALFLSHRPDTPLEGPLMLVVELVWPWNKSDSKRVREAGRIPHATKPDWENIAKTIGDSMGRCAFFVNDSQIVSGTVLKYRGDNPGITVCLKPFLVTGANSVATMS